MDQSGNCSSTDRIKLRSNPYEYYSGKAGTLVPAFLIAFGVWSDIMTKGTVLFVTFIKEMSMSKASEEFIKKCVESDSARDKGLKTPSDIERFDDIEYGPDKKWQLLDVYRLKEHKESSPVIVNVHGGGWVYGDKELYQYYCMNLAQRGFTVVNFTYHLAPEYKFPTSIEDTNLVFEWVLKNADKYGMDTDNIFAVGDSAGAQMLAIYACIHTNPDYASKFTFKTPKGLKIKGMGLSCGLYAVEKEKSISLFEDFLEKKGSPEELSMVSPANFVTEAFPHCYVFTSNGDFLRSQAPFMTEALKKNGIKYVFKEYGDKDHELFHVFQCDIRSDAAKEANDDQCGFFKDLI